MFNSQSILITGGCGFIGSNFVNYIVPKYPKIKFYNLDAMYYCANQKNVTVSNQENYKFIKGNITNFDFMVHLLQEHQVDGIIHFAAQSHVDNSFQEPLKYTYDNVLGTHTILESVRMVNPKIKILHISTDEVYGESITDESFPEKNIFYPTNPYSATKAGAELLVHSYIKSYQMDIIVTRGNNVYGPHQYPEKLIPKFITQLSENKKCTIHGKGTAIRAFLHVSDVVKAIELISQKGKSGDVFNIGTHDEYTVMEVAKKLINHLKPNDDIEKWITYVPDRNFNDTRYFINLDKLAKLGWKQQVEFKEGLISTIQHYLPEWKAKK